MKILVLLFLAVFIIFVFLLSEPGQRMFILLKRFLLRLPPPRISADEAQDIAIEEAIRRGVARPNFRTVLEDARRAGYGGLLLSVSEYADGWYVDRRNHGIDFEAMVDNQDGHIIFFSSRPPLTSDYNGYYGAGLGRRHRKAGATGGEGGAGSGDEEA